MFASTDRADNTYSRHLVDTRGRVHDSGSRFGFTWRLMGSYK